MAEDTENITISSLQTDPKYSSCIKVHGYRILPPLLSEEKRQEMLYYKSLAMQVENKLRAKEEEKESLTDGDVPTDTSVSESVTSNDKSTTEDPTYKSQLSFNDTRSDILNMLSEHNETVKSNDKLVMPSIDSSAIIKVPLTDSNNGGNLESNASVLLTNALALAKKITPYVIIRQQSYTLENSDKVFSEELLKKLVNVNGSKSTASSSTNNSESNYSDKEEASNKNELNFVTNINENEQGCNNTESCDNTIVAVLDESNENTVYTPGSLVRSNSYILDTPSPYLLAKMQESNKESDVLPSNDGVLRKRKSWNLENAKKKWSSIEHELSETSNNKEINTNANVTSTNDRPTCNSLPVSPHRKMFLTTLVDSPSSSHTKRTIFKVYKGKSTDTLHNCQNVTPPKNRFQKRIISKNDAQRRIIRALITPTRNILEKQSNRELSLKPTYSDSKPKKSDITSNNKTDIVITKPRAVIKQRSLFLSSPPDKDVPRSEPATADNNAVTPLKNSLVLNPVNVQDKIRDIISKVQEEQSKQMSELIAKQKREQEFLMKAFAEQQALIISKLHNTYKDVLSPGFVKASPVQNEPKSETNSVINGHKRCEYSGTHLTDNELLKNSENLLLECKQLLSTKHDFESDSLESGRTSSQTIFCAALSSPEYLPDDLNVTVESNGSDSASYASNVSSMTNVPFASVQSEIITSASYSQSFSEDSLEKSARFKSESSSRAVLAQIQKNIAVYDKLKSENQCRQQLFPSLTQVWATNTICAAARGYLVRRLMKTERVQTLIQTIKDTLICAVELHNEETDNIQPADVELHRRLLLQVTAACCNFHDIFFSLSKAEQMSVISMDRERQKEKLLRPVSARSNSSLSSATQRSLERKMRKEMESSNDSAHKPQRSCSSAQEFRSRAKSVELTDSAQKKRSSSQSCMIRRTMSYGANRKPWR